MVDISAMQLNWVDYLILLIFLFAFLSGMTKGFVKEIVSLITLIAAFVIASTYAESLSTVFTHTSAAQQAVSTISSSTGINTEKPASFLAIGVSFGIIFIGVSIIGSIVGYFLGMATSAMGVLNLGNRLMGGLFGLGKGFIINLVLIFVLQLTAVGSQSWWTSSSLVHEYQPAVQWLGSYISPALSGISAKVNDAWQQVNRTIQSGATNQ